jgi:hypothetical protein
MIKRLVARLLVGIALVFAPVAEAAAPNGIVTAQDLFDTCADQSPTAQAICDTYVHATIQTAEIVHAADHGGKLEPLFCPGDQMVAQDLVAVLRLQADADPERKNFPAPALIIGGAIDAYPCAKPATPAAPAHKPAAHRTHPTSQ